MQRRVPSFVATDYNLLSSGLQPDRHNLQKLLWEHALNCTFAAGKVKRKLPSAQIFSLGAGHVRGLGQQFSQVGGRWLWAGIDNDVVRWQFGAPETIVNNMAGYQQDQTVNLRPTIYDFTSFGDWMIINNGSGAAKIHKPPAAAADYVGDGHVPTDVLRFMKRQSYMMAIGHGNRGTEISWSDADAIEVWEALATNLAGTLSIDEFDTPMRAASKLGDAITCYSEDQMALVRSIGLPFVFGQKVALDGIGAIGKAAVATDWRLNYGVGRAGIWRTDGANANYIDEGFLHDYLQEEANWDQGGKIVAVRNDYTGCIEFFFPMRGSLTLNEGWSYDPRSGGWSPIPFVSFKDERRLFSGTISGNHAGAVLLDDDDPALAGPLELRTIPLQLTEKGTEQQTTNIVTRLDEVTLLLKKATAVEFRVGVNILNEDQPELDYEWTPWIAAQISVRNYPLPNLPEGVFHKLEFRSTAQEWDLDLQGFMLYGVPVGSK